MSTPRQDLRLLRDCAPVHVLSKVVIDDACASRSVDQRHPTITPSNKRHSLHSNAAPSPSHKRGNSNADTIPEAAPDFRRIASSSVNSAGSGGGNTAASRRATNERERERNAERRTTNERRRTNNPARSTLLAPARRSSQGPVLAGAESVSTASDRRSSASAKDAKEADRHAATLNSKRQSSLDKDDSPTGSLTPEAAAQLERSQTLNNQSRPAANRGTLPANAVSRSTTMASNPVRSPTNAASGGTSPFGRQQTITGGSPTRPERSAEIRTPERRIADSAKRHTLASASGVQQFNSGSIAKTSGAGAGAGEPGSADRPARRTVSGGVSVISPPSLERTPSRQPSPNSRNKPGDNPQAQASPNSANSNGPTSSPRPPLDRLASGGSPGVVRKPRSNTMPEQLPGSVN